MNCTQVRALLHAPARPGDPVASNAEARRHLANCAGCADYGRRLAEIQQALSAHHGRVTPAPGFASRVRARLPRQDDPLGWAALRFLPATVGLVLLLSWLNWQQSASSEVAVTDPTSAVLTWALEAPDAGADS
jgi:hypothetical protein